MTILESKNFVFKLKPDTVLVIGHSFLTVDIFGINVSECLFSEWLIAKHFLPNIFAIWSRYRMSFCGIESCQKAKLRRGCCEMTYTPVN